MDIQLLLSKFERIGARAKVAVAAAVDRARIDIGSDGRGQFFDVRIAAQVAADALDVRPRDRHLLMAVRPEDRLGLPIGGGERFLCGHDEREWFVAAIPGGRPASNVAQAMDALRPLPVQWALRQRAVRFERRNRRRNAAFVRQGEWFFVPQEHADVPPGEIRRDEPLVRTGGKPHLAEFAHRSGGEAVFVNDRTGRVLSAAQYRRLLEHHPVSGRVFTEQRRNVSVLVRGRVSHPDHKTIVLNGWHAVYMNTEHESDAMKHVAFID